jgi:amino acid permease
MDNEKREVIHERPSSTFSHKEETKIETLTDESDRITSSSLESQEEPQLKRSLKARHLAVS